MYAVNLDEGQLDIRSAVPWYTRVWASVLRRAAVDWVLYRAHPNVKLKKRGRDAELWIFNQESGDDISSFDSICSIMGISSEFIQARISRLTEGEARRLRGMEFGDSW